MIPNIIILGKELSPYMLFSLAGVLVILFFTRRLAQKRGLDDIHVLSMLLFAFLGVFLGGHILYGITQGEYVIYVLTNLHKLDSFSLLIGTLMRIFGGSVFYGGLIGAVVVCLIYIKRCHLPPGAYTDLVAIAIPLFHFFGRLGCFTSGCCYGIPWEQGITYHYAPMADANGIPRFPVQLAEAGLNLLLFLVLYRLLKKDRLQGRLLALYFTVYPAYRFLLEFLRGDAIRGFLGPLSTSQILSILFLAGSCLYWLVTFRKSSKQTK